MRVHLGLPQGRDRAGCAGQPHRRCRPCGPDPCEGNGYGVLRDYVGHGVGRAMHEDPNVPNYGKKGRGVKLQAGMVIAIEPMITLGSNHVHTGADGCS